MRRILIPSLFAAAGLAAALASQPAAADPVQAFSFSSATFATYDIETAELGYDFTTGAQALDVTALGYINDGYNGTHTVSIFDVATQSFVAGATATVTTVGGGSTSTSFTYTNLADPVQLAADTEYQIVSQFYPDEYYFIDAQGFSSADGLTFDDAVYDDYNSVPATPTYARGVAAVNNPGDFGPNLLVTTVPEPSSLAILGAALLGLGVVVRRRRRA